MKLSENWMIKKSKLVKHLFCSSKCHFHDTETEDNQLQEAKTEVITPSEGL